MGTRSGTYTSHTFFKLMDRKDETCPLALIGLPLEIIAKCGRKYALEYSVGSSPGDTGNGGDGWWPDGPTSRERGPVGEQIAASIAS
ncbi:hypothetical protein PoB_003487100 [Plakobranchus ocellatus]|uniref:Uncharacterized protein n=1 Tax=Plakobranchus ocellatus TaxID=259542 RepID=A0AAV4AB24_9GAST|nr:hypothetical protein PoB_003487100 [Plakobranchus ocellatus]